MKLIEVKRAVSKRDDSTKRKVKFNNFRYYEGYGEECLFYETEFGEVFPVPLSETKGATFNNEDNALLFMRYMLMFNKYVKSQTKKHT